MTDDDYNDFKKKQDDCHIEIIRNNKTKMTKWNEIEQTTINERQSTNQPIINTKTFCTEILASWIFFLFRKISFFFLHWVLWNCLFGWLVDKLLDWNNHHHHHHQNGNEHHQQIYFFVFFFSSIISMKQWSKKQHTDDQFKASKTKKKRREENQWTKMKRNIIVRFGDGDGEKKRKDWKIHLNRTDEKVKFKYDFFFVDIMMMMMEIL